MILCGVPWPERGKHVSIHTKSWSIYNMQQDVLLTSAPVANINIQQ